LTTAAIRYAKLQSNLLPSTNERQVFLTGQMPSCHPTNSVRAVKEKGVLIASHRHATFTYDDCAIYAT